MSKKLVFLLVLALLNPVFAFGKKNRVRSEPGQKTLKVVLIVNTLLGDQSFFDSAARGLKQAQARYGDKINTQVIETGIDETKWLPALHDYAADGSWDIIIVGSWNMREPLAEIAPQYPAQKFILFDEVMDYQGGQFRNVYSILYRQNESSFLAGALAAQATSASEMKLNNPQKKVIGFIGAMSLPVINDFLVGYIQGARYVDPDIKVVVSYVGDFSDTPKAKDLTTSQYTSQGVDVVFHAAGLGGLGVIDAAVEQKKYVIGVDSDQAEMLGLPAAQHILTSALKNVDASLLRAIDLHLKGKLPYGNSETLGLEAGSVGIAQNSYYESLVPPKIREKIVQLTQQIQAGEIKVDSALGKSTAEINRIIDSAR